MKKRIVYRVIKVLDGYLMIKPSRARLVYWDGEQSTAYRFDTRAEAEEALADLIDGDYLFSDYARIVRVIRWE